MGGNVVLKYLSEVGAHADLLGAVTISAPIDLRATAHCITSKRNRLYHAHLIEGMRQERGLDAKDIRTITEYDNRIVAPENGFRDAENITPNVPQHRVSAVSVCRRSSSTPPTIPGFRSRPTARCVGTTTRSCHLKLPVSGGHIGFHGIGLDRPWYDLAILRFLDILRHKTQ